MSDLGHLGEFDVPMMQEKLCAFLVYFVLVLDFTYPSEPPDGVKVMPIDCGYEVYKAPPAPRTTVGFTLLDRPKLCPRGGLRAQLPYGGLRSD